MSGFRETLQQSGATRRVWLDSDDYCEKLLSPGVTPLLDGTSFAAWQRKSLGLLRPDVAVMNVARAVDAWLQASPALRSAMGAKTREVYPIKTLLADDAMRAHLLDLVRGLRGVSGGLPLALVMPSPRAWVTAAYAQGHGEEIAAGEDEADSAGVFIADFLRVFADAGIDLAVMQEAAEFVPAGGADFECYQSVFNVAAYYRWDIGLHLAHAGGGLRSLPEQIGFAIAPAILETVPTVLALGSGFSRGEAPPDALFCFWRIPVDAEPELVLEHLAALR